MDELTLSLKCQGSYCPKRPRHMMKLSICLLSSEKLPHVDLSDRPKSRHIELRASYHVITAPKEPAPSRMLSSTSNSSLARSRSLRSNSLKPPSSLNPQPTAPALGLSNVNLFLTNLRLLELDTRDDWPGISVLTFSTTTRQENQKKRIECVEWALYHLFALWDPEETRNVRLQ